MRLVLALTLFASLSFATSITYTITDVFPDGTVTTPLSAANVPFVLTFSLPDHPVPSSSFADAFNIYGPAVTFTFGSTTTSFSSNPDPAGPFASISFADPTQGGGLTAILDIPGHSIFEQTTMLILGFSSSQLFSGIPSAPTMLPGEFPVLNEGHFSYVGTGSLTFFSDSGNISAVADFATPEPAPVSLIGLALPALLIIRGRRSRSTAASRD